MSYTTNEIKLINKTTTKFYFEVAESFSETRQHEWDGWRRSLPYVKEAKTLLDLGCGNRRYTKFLEENNLNVKVDNYDNFSWDDMWTDIERSSTSIPIKQVDIIDSLLNDTLNLNTYDVAVCFGVMHHVPTSKLREKLLRELCKSKVAIISFWQFEKDERIFNKANETTKIAQEKLGLQNLEDNDYFLGWKDREDIFRFCHNFTDSEIDIIKQKFDVTDDFSADGSNALNRYLVLKERHA